MLLETTSFESALAAATGDDRSLAEELRRDFIEGAANHIDLLCRARCDGNWRMSAQRLQALGLTFHAKELVTRATAALEAAPGDPVALRRLRSWLEKADQRQQAQDGSPPKRVA